jgi:2-oxoisovalerate dehydrogenase E1 component
MPDQGSTAPGPEAKREAIDQHFIQSITRLGPGWLRAAKSPAAPSAPVRPRSGLTGEMALRLFDAQVASRHLDLAARWLRERGEGYYTIGSSGHEGNAAVAAALHPTDPALLHYRSGAFYLTRADQVGETGLGQDPILDVLLGLAGAADEPIAGGRHKVFGRAELAIIPQTSTIASHLPRAVGVAFAIERARKLRAGCTWPLDAVVVCSFGDASANHSTALGAINAACYTAYRGLPMPVLFVCEDNGWGISVPTAPGWVERAHAAIPQLRYLSADGSDLAGAYDTAREAARWVREHRKPAFLHLKVVRFMGHAGSDPEVSYRSPSEVAADYERDPLLVTSRLLVEAGLLSPEEVLTRYEASRAKVMRLAGEAVPRPRLRDAAEVMEPLAPRRPDRVAADAARSAPEDQRRAVFEGRLPEEEGPLTLALAINRALADGLACRPGMLVFGEDVGRKGGVYGVTRRLTRRFGAARVFDTLLDESSILGLGLGTAVSGLLPVPEIQYLAYLHNAADQLRGEAATLQFFSQGQYRNGMVVRIAGYAYQRGFGGHFHNDNAIASLRDIPGLVIASPARPDDAASMLRTSLAAAEEDGTVTAFLEPIALYHTADLYRNGDGGWLAPYAAPGSWARCHVPIGSARTYGDGSDITLVSFANGLAMSLRVARRLEEAGVGTRVVDLRWLAPLPVDDLVREAKATGTVLVVDETRRSGGVSEGVMVGLAEAGYEGKLARVTSHDSFVPLGDAAYHVLLSEAAVEKAARELLG